jgi:hypothetical protein
MLNVEGLPQHHEENGRANYQLFLNLDSTSEAQRYQSKLPCLVLKTKATEVAFVKLIKSPLEK